jgi:hypothetical protein
VTKKAAIVIADDVETLFCDDGARLHTVVHPSEQLLADLRLLVRYVEKRAPDDELCDAAQRVRELLPKEET